RSPSKSSPREVQRAAGRLVLLSLPGRPVVAAELNAPNEMLPKTGRLPKIESSVWAAAPGYKEQAPYARGVNHQHHPRRRRRARDVLQPGERLQRAAAA